MVKFVYSTTTIQYDQSNMETCPFPQDGDPFKLRWMCSEKESDTPPLSISLNSASPSMLKRITIRSPQYMSSSEPPPRHSNSMGLNVHTSHVHG